MVRNIVESSFYLTTINGSIIMDEYSSSNDYVPVITAFLPNIDCKSDEFYLT